jgi:hypothetical protein
MTQRFFALRFACEGFSDAWWWLVGFVGKGESLWNGGIENLGVLCLWVVHVRERRRGEEAATSDFLKLESK